MNDYIYGLADPRTGSLRYIGITRTGIERRLRKHLKDTRGGSHLPVHVWCRKLAALGMAPIAILIEECDNRDRESFWIAHYRAAGCVLLNCTDGGEGAVGCRHTPETRERMRISALARIRVPLSPEHKAKIGDANRGRPGRMISGEERARRSATNRRLGIRPPVMRGDANPARINPSRMSRGSSHGNAKLTEDQVKDMRARYADGSSTTTELAREYRLCRERVWHIVTYRSWLHVE